VVNSSGVAALGDLSIYLFLFLFFIFYFLFFIEVTYDYSPAVVCFLDAQVVIISPMS